MNSTPIYGSSLLDLNHDVSLIPIVLLIIDTHYDSTALEASIAGYSNYSFDKMNDNRIP